MRKIYERNVLNPMGANSGEIPGDFLTCADAGIIVGWLTQGARRIISEEIFDREHNAMSDVLERHHHEETLTAPQELEGDHDLIVQMAIKMAGWLPDDPDQAAEVLALTADVYAVLTESRTKSREH